MRIKSMFFAVILSFIFISNVNAKIFKLSETELPNGLKVVTVEDNSSPVITLQMFIDASVRKEKPGITGMSHFFEHYFHMSSKNYSFEEISEKIAKWGGRLNAYTNKDFTTYHASVPKIKMDSLIELYADMLANKNFTKANFESELNVVREERRLTDNNPYAVAYMEFFKLLYPDAPYGTPVLGNWEDLKSMKLEDVKKYYRDYYSVKNILVVVAGDVDHSEVLKSLNKWFGPIKPTANRKVKDTKFKSQKQERRKIKERDGQKLPILLIGYEGIKFDDPDYFPLMALSEILSDGESSRFSNILVKDRKVAQSAYSYVMHFKERGIFVVGAEPIKGISPSVLEREIYSVIEEIKNEGPKAAELEKVVKQNEKSFITGLQTTSSKADLVGRSYMLSKHKYDFYENYLENLKKVTLGDIKRVANKYLLKNKRNVYIQIPQGTSYYGTTLKDVSMKKYKDVNEIEFKNGLKLYFQYSDEIPAVSVDLLFKSGSSFDPKGKEGLANLAAGLLGKGTKRYDEKAIAKIFDDNAIGYSSYSSKEAMAVSMNFLNEKTDLSMEILLDIIGNPDIKTEVFLREKERILSSIEASKANPRNAVGRALSRILFKGSGLEHPVSGYEKTIRKIGLKDVYSFYNRYFKTSNLIVSVVGKLDLEYLVDLVGYRFRNFDTGKVKESPVDKQINLSGINYYVIDMPWLSQSYIMVGGQGLARNHNEYSTARVMNYILGGASFTSRLWTLRAQKGLAYSVGSSFDYYKNTGSFEFSIQTKTQSTRNALEEFFKQIDMFVSQGVTKKEFDNSKSYYEGVIPFRIETMGQKSSGVANGVFYGKGPLMIYSDLDEINALTLDNINEIAQKMLKKNFAVVIAGKKDELNKQLKQMGKVKQIKLESLF